MKGLSILVVVLIHTSNVCGPRPGDVFWRNVLHSLIMPLFFFLSGYVALECARGRRAGERLGKKARGLVVPFLSWYFLFGAVETGMFRDGGLAGHAWSLVRNPYAGRWFLLVLFYCFVALVAAQKLEKRLGIFAFPLLLLVVSIIPAAARLSPSGQFLGLKAFQQVFPFFIGGYLVARYRKEAKRLLERKGSARLFGAAGLLAFPSLIATGLASDRVADNVFRSYMAVAPAFNPGFLLALLVAFVEVAFVVAAFFRKKTDRGIGWLAWLGGYSLDIYVVHSAGTYFVMRMMSGPLSTGDSALRLPVLAFITLCATAFSLLVSIFLLRRSAVLRFLFLGRAGGRTPDRAPERTPAPRRARPRISTASAVFPGQECS